MGWGYWALSGGSDFTPERRANTVATQDPTLQDATGQAEAAGDAARAAALAAAPQAATLTPAVPTPAAEAQTVAAPVFTSLAQRRENLAAAAAAEAAARALAPPILRPAAAAGADLRVVDADRVNLRDGPGTDYVAIGQLTNGTIAEITEYGTGNWVRVKVQGTDQSGWMSARYLLSLD